MTRLHAEPATPIARPLLRSLLSTLLSVAALWLLVAFPASRLLDQISAPPVPSAHSAPQPASTPHS